MTVTVLRSLIFITYSILDFMVLLLCFLRSLTTFPNASKFIKNTLLHACIGVSALLSVFKVWSNTVFLVSYKLHKSIKVTYTLFNLL